MTTEPFFVIATDRIESTPTFNELRQLAQHPRLRPLIDQRKDRIAFRPWTFKPESRYHDTESVRNKCIRLNDRFQHPDGVTQFQHWLRILLEDLFVLDAAACYIYRAQDSSDIFFRPVDGASIGLLVDSETMDPPPATLPFAAQVTGEQAVYMQRKDLVYCMMNKQEGRVYGYSKLEQMAANELAEQQNVLPESRDGSMFRIFAPLLGPVEEESEWIAEHLIDELVRRAYGETHCRFRWQ